METVITTVVYGDKAPLWEKWMAKSVKKVYAHKAEYHRVLPNIASLDAVLGQCQPAVRTTYVKTRMWNMFGGSRPSSNPMWKKPSRPIWVLDADVLLVKPLSWHPSSDKIMMAACRGGDEKYLGFIEKAGIPLCTDVTINIGVMWFFGDIHPRWNRLYPQIRDALGDSPYSASETTLTAVWHELKAEGKAELLPVSYNQIISEHGLDGATIFHLAGAPEHFKAQLMESYFKYIYPDDHG